MCRYTKKSFVKHFSSFAKHLLRSMFYLFQNWNGAKSKRWDVMQLLCCSYWSWTNLNSKDKCSKLGQFLNENGANNEIKKIHILPHVGKKWIHFLPQLFVRMVAFLLSSFTSTLYCTYIYMQTALETSYMYVVAILYGTHILFLSVYFSNCWQLNN